MNGHLYPSMDEGNHFFTDPSTTYYAPYPGMIDPIYRPPLNRLNGGKDPYVRPQLLLPPSHSFPSETTTSRASSCLSSSLSIISPLLAEFVSIFVTLFVFNHLDSELQEMQTISLHRSMILSLSYALCLATFTSAFKSVHGSPMITLSHLLSGSTSYLFGLLIFPIQLVAGLLAVTANASLRHILPPPPSLKHDLKTHWQKAAYQLIFSQLIGCFLLCSSHLSSLRVERRRDLDEERGLVSKFRIGLLENPAVPIFLSATIASFLSLLQSSVISCPLEALSIGLYGLMMNGLEGGSLSIHYIYWIGPVLGSLLACAICKFLLSSRILRDPRV